MLSDERRSQIIDRVTPLFQLIDSELQLHDVLLDSTRTQLLFVLQKLEWPVVITMDWLDYVSNRDPELVGKFKAALDARKEAAQARLADEEHV
ncbi:MAG: hypothetical protein HY046_13980 [Acidobacteria bacterium]|nr:hypothetical protein [Acidobacteriota bacterium]